MNLVGTDTQMFGYKSIKEWSNQSIKSYNRDCHFQQGGPLR